MARVVLDLPPVNIVGADLIIGLFPLLDELEASDVSVAVFRSADPDFFLMHGDVEMLVGDAARRSRWRPPSRTWRPPSSSASTPRPT